MDKKRALVLVPSMLLVILAISIIVRGQLQWGVLILLGALASLFWRIRQKRMKMERKYYNPKEIEEKFISYKNLKESNITDDEYKIFCGELQYLPAIIIDTIFEEIHFVLMSADPETGNPACYVNLRGFDVKKKGIVVLSPQFFGAPYCDKNGNKKIYTAFDHGFPILLEEVAHHILNHSYRELIEKDENEASDKVKEWMNQFRESRFKE